MHDQHGACPETSLLEDFHKARLAGPAARIVALHIEACATCRAELAELSLDDLFAGDLRELLPQGPSGSDAEPARIQDLDTEREALQELLRKNREGQRYELLGELGHGGMGIVYEVLDQVLQRKLAMKVIRTGADEGVSPASPSGRRLARFLEEVRISSRLDHPSIIPVHELGIDAEGRAYFTMRKVRGRDLGEVFKEFERGEGDATLQSLVAIVLRACEALAHAHSMGVVHRDLKPANIMVEGFGAVYVMDWGVAKVLGASEQAAGDQSSLILPERSALPAGPDAEVDPGAAPLTLVGEILGTPAYMAPEQARGGAQGTSIQSDIYSMGAILYRLLSGRRPYDDDGESGTPVTAWQRLLQGPPTPLAELAPKAPPELIAICERAMARMLIERYADMAGLTADLRAWLEGRVVRAYRTGLRVEAGKWLRRNPALASAVLIALLVVSAVLVRQSVVEARARDRVARAVSLNAARALLEMDPAQALREAIPVVAMDGNHTTRSTLLAALVSPAIGASFAGVPALRMTPPAWSPTGELVIAQLDSDGEGLTLRVWNAAARRFTEESYPGPRGSEHVTIFDPTGRRIASAGSAGSIWIHDRETGESQLVGDGGRAHTDTVSCLAFDDEGSLLASGSYDGSVKLWDAALGTAVKRLDGHSGIVTAISFDASGERLLSASGPAPRSPELASDHTVRIWDATSGECLLVFEGHREPVTTAHFDPLGEHVLSTSYDRTAKLWSAQGGEVLRTFEFESVGWDGAFAHDGSQLAVAFDSGFLVFEIETGIEKRLAKYEAHDGRAVTEVEFSPDDNRLLTVGYDRALRVWRLATGHAPQLEMWLRPQNSYVASWSPDGTLIAGIDRSSKAQIWHAEGNPTTDWARPSTSPATHARFHPAGDRVLLCFERGPAYEYGFDPGQGLHSGRALGLAPARDATASGAWTVVAEAGGPLRLWRRDASGLNQEAGVVELDVFSLHPSRRDELMGLILVGDEGAAALDLSGSTPAVVHLARGQSITAIDFADGGLKVATGSADGVIQVMDLTSGRELSRSELPAASSHNKAIYDLRFCDRGQQLLVASSRVGVELRDIASRDLIWHNPASNTTIGRLFVLGDGRVITCDKWGSNVCSTILADGRASNSLATSYHPGAHRNRITSSSLDSARRRLLTSSLDHTATIWDLERFEPWVSFAAHDGPVLAGDISRDGRWAVTADATGRAFVWPTDPLDWVPQARPDAGSAAR